MIILELSPDQLQSLANINEVAGGTKIVFDRVRATEVNVQFITPEGPSPFAAALTVPRAEAS